MTPKLQVVVFWVFQKKRNTSFPRTYAPVDENLEKVKTRGESSVMIKGAGGIANCQGS
jgi:hypothetical protein